MNKHIFYLAGLSIFGFSLALAGCDDVDTKLSQPSYNTTIDQKTTRASAFKDAFPRQYATYKQNDNSDFKSKYTAAFNFEKHNGFDPIPKGFKGADQPYLKNLWLGYPFSYEYNEARGHTHAIEDFLNIDRLNRYAEKGSLPSTCWNCKTPHMMRWIEEYGNDFWAKDVNTFRDKLDVFDESISCPICHDPKTMELRPYSEPFKDWLARTGQDWSKISRNEKRAMMCGQCHVEYYFTQKDHGPNLRPVFPWDNGFDPEDMYTYYKDKGPKDANGNFTQFVDWVHPVSKVPMLKAQHPEFSIWRDGPHGAAGVSCADCHMSYKKINGKKISSHHLTSPFVDPDLKACRQCHADKTADFLKNRVRFIQDRTYKKLLEAQDASVRAHEAVRLANEWKGEKSPNYDTLMAQAYDMVRKGQFFWDLISAENSMGFHNPTKCLTTLMTSFECSSKAVQLASEATNFGISPSLAGDIHKIVPPIKEFSRKLQQDPNVIASHPWLKYLPVLPKAEKVWEREKHL